MRRIITILLVIGSVVFLTSLGWLAVGIYSSHQMDSFFYNRNAEDGFRRRLQAALTDGKEARLHYYSIADEFPLDGEFAETFHEGLEELIKTVGSDVVGNEIASPKTRWYFDQITRN